MKQLLRGHVTVCRGEPHQLVHAMKAGAEEPARVHPQVGIDQADLCDILERWSHVRDVTDAMESGQTELELFQDDFVDDILISEVIHQYVEELAVFCLPSTPAEKVPRCNSLSEGVLVQIPERQLAQLGEVVAEQRSDVEQSNRVVLGFPQAVITLWEYQGELLQGAPVSPQQGVHVLPLDAVSCDLQASQAAAGALTAE
eukprot:639152-Hanusia_phi.AAC.3